MKSHKIPGALNEAPLARYYLKIVAISGMLLALLCMSSHNASAGPVCIEAGGDVMCSGPEIGDWQYGAMWDSSPSIHSGWLFSGVGDALSYLTGQKQPRSGCQSADAPALDDFVPFFYATFPPRPAPQLLGVYRRNDAAVNWFWSRIDTPACPAYIYGDPGANNSGYIGRIRDVSCPAGYVASDKNDYCYQVQPPCDCEGGVSVTVGNPMRVADGAKMQYESDYMGATAFPLIFARYYNSFSFYQPVGTQVKAPRYTQV